LEEKIYGKEGETNTYLLPPVSDPDGDPITLQILNIPYFFDYVGRHIWLTPIMGDAGTYSAYVLLKD